MNVGLALSLGSLGLLAVAHSALGEARLIGPLAAGELPRLTMPPAFAKSVLRFAWHLTSVAWLGLAGVLIVAPGSAWVVGLTLAVSGVITLVASRGAHFAWALFLVGALGAGYAVGPGAGRAWVSVTSAVIAFGLGALHVAWAAGLRQGLSAAIPQRDGKPLFVPSRGVTLLVALGLGALGMIFLALGGFVSLPGLSGLALAAAVVFAVRTVGDFRTVGLFKRPGRDAFARNDARLYTPLTFSLAAALLWLR
jgi:hypothetical protein